MDPFSAIGAIGGSAISGAFGAQANAANLQFAQQQASGAFLPAYYANLRAAGVNPYATGVGGAASAGSPGQTNPVPNLGQDLSRAFSAVQAKDDKLQALQASLLKSQITHQDLINQGMIMSQATRAVAPPDQPFHGGSSGIPLPMNDPRGLGKGRPNLWTDYYDNPTAGNLPGNVAMLSPEAQRSVFSGVPMAPLYPFLAAAMSGKNLESAGRTYWDTLKDIYRYSVPQN